MVRVSEKEFNQLKQSLTGLEETWENYQLKMPDGWYIFKYQTIMGFFIRNSQEKQLLSQAKQNRILKYIKIPNAAYHEMKELASINLELKEALEHPPYGLKDVVFSEKTE